MACRAENQRMGALVVLQTLVPNAREIFKILAQDRLASEEDVGKFVCISNFSLPGLVIFKAAGGMESLTVQAFLDAKQ